MRTDFWMMFWQRSFFTIQSMVMPLFFPLFFKHFIMLLFSICILKSAFLFEDVIERLNVLRGRVIASMYSWSGKRSYKNGYVWHDLCDNDIVHPAQGNDYILKGTEIFQESNPGPTDSKSTTRATIFQKQRGTSFTIELEWQSYKGCSE
ncbi:hypothetical protein ACS0TY_012851 [Phlomoides rotata]